jgi:signal peptidase complex subunit 1
LNCHLIRILFWWGRVRQQKKMDWQGQKRAEMLMQVLLVASAVAAFVAGYVLSDFQLMLLVYAGGVVLTTLVTVPDWPWFNRNPLKWLDAAEAERHPRPQVSAGAGAGVKKKSGKNK